MPACMTALQVHRGWAPLVPQLEPESEDGVPLCEYNRLAEEEMDVLQILKRLCDTFTGCEWSGATSFPVSGHFC